jgi:DHA1 family bicyclomycin/chloramphenicol resistance-like MFS transporter
MSDMTPRAAVPRDGERLSGWLAILGALTALAPLSIDMYLPGFPSMEADLGAPAGSAELTLAGYFIGMSLGQLFWGPLSDRFGRKPPLYAALVLYIGAALACAQAVDVAGLTAWRVLQALGGSAGMVIARAVIRDRCATRAAARAFSLLILVMGLAPILAPLLGGWVLHAWGWRAIFLVMAGFAGACLVAVHFGLAESHDTTHEAPLRLGQIVGNYAGLCASRAFLGYTLSSGLAMAGMFAYIAGSPFVLIQLGGIPAQHFGWAFGGNALGYIVASQINVRLLCARMPSDILRRALWLPALASLCLLLMQLSGASSLPLMLLALFVYVASLGFVAPNACACALATHGQQAGTASALMGALQFGLATLAGIAISRLHDGSALPLAGVLALCGLGALALHRGLVRRHEHKDGPAPRA